MALWELAVLELLIIVAVWVAFHVVWTVIGVFYLAMLQKALSRCSPQNRTLSPALVWLQLIPLFGLVWHFGLVFNVTRSLRAEFAARGIVEDLGPAQGIGLSMCVLNAIAIIPYLGILTGFVALVCWIIYWVKIAGFSKKIASPYGPPAPPTVTASAA